MRRTKPGDTIGRRYRLLELLGKGGMGTVHLAKDRLGGLVALKRLAVEQYDDEAESIPEREVRTPAYAPAAALASGDAPTIALGTFAIPPSPRSPSRTAAIASTVWHQPLQTVEGHVEPAPETRTSGVDPVSAVMPGAPGVTSGSSPSYGDPMAEVMRLTLAREFRILSSLRHPNIISVLDYGFDDDDLSPYFTMELLEGASTIMAAGAALPLEGRLDLLAQMLQALSYLHRRGVIHRDLKPGNVMVMGGQVKVLDFGVSTGRGRERELDSGRLIVGTLAYMAPEVLHGAPASEASDLFAVGMIAYELFAERYPYDMSDLYRLRDQILHKPPDLSPLDPRIAPVVGRLLEKNPTLRHESVDALFADLSERTSRRLVLETAATRESFLQAAELVGRDAEIAELYSMLGAAMATRGGGALVGGESGVGKTRLFDEVRARALVDGMVVLRGQGVSEGGGPYHVFRDVLRGMTLRADPDDFEAGVLQALVPDIAALIGREVPPREELDPEAAHTRLCAVVEDMFRRQHAPVLVILEDLHWAGSESLRLLARLVTLARDLPLLILGSYRDDERPDLPRELPMVRTLKLQRLSGDGIAALAASMLGKAGKRPEVVARLTRETEGNPFFLVEVVRALAEDAGALSLVGVEPMPRTLSAGGLHLIVRRRLDQVPRLARPLLQAAAVIGRRIDVRLLRRLDPQADIDAWIRTCANVAVLDFGEGSYRFAHDKLREGLLDALPQEASRALHRRVALAIEAEYPDDPGFTTALARHWAVAGDTAKEAHHSALAGEQALQSSAYREAVAFFERAIEIVAEANGGTPSERDGLTGRLLARARTIVPFARETVGSTSDRFRLGLWEGRLSEACGRMSNHAEAYRHGERALAYLGRPMPRGQLGLVAGLPVQVALRGLMSMWPDRFAEASSDGRAVLLEATRIQARVTEACFYTQEALPLFWSGLSTLNLGEPAGPSGSLACGYAMMAAAAGLVPVHAAAELFCRRAVELVESVGKPYDIAFVDQRVSVYRLWMGNWDVAAAGLTRALEVSRRVSDVRAVGDAKSCLMLGEQFHGRFRVADRLLDELEAWAQRIGDKQVLGGARISRAALLTRQGDPVRALAAGREVQPAIDAAGVSHELIRCHGVLALAHVVAGAPDAARASLDRALGVLRVTRPVAYWTFDGISAAAEAALALWEASRSPEDEARARAACKAARTFAGIFPIGLPFSLRWEGLLAQLSGDARRVRKCWDRCIAEAERLDMPYERGRTWFEIGRHLRPGDPDRAHLLQRAESVFADVGAELDRGLALAELMKG